MDLRPAVTAGAQAIRGGAESRGSVYPSDTAVWGEQLTGHPGNAALPASPVADYMQVSGWGESIRSELRACLLSRSLQRPARVLQRGALQMAVLVWAPGGLAPRACSPCNTASVSQVHKEIAHL